MRQPERLNGRFSSNCLLRNCLLRTVFFELDSRRSLCYSACIDMLTKPHRYVIYAYYYFFTGERHPLLLDLG